MDIDYGQAHKITHHTRSGVQARCNLLGFDCGTVDGINGSKTKAGVSDFQYEHDLEVDGIAGAKTKA